MAVTVAEVFRGRGQAHFTVVATADADTTATITHGLRATPEEVTITPRLSQALAAMSNWAVTTINATSVVCTKLTTVGSGNAAVQLLVIVKRAKTFRRPA